MSLGAEPNSSKGASTGDPKYSKRKDINLQRVAL